MAYHKILGLLLIGAGAVAVPHTAKAQSNGPGTTPSAGNSTGNTTPGFSNPANSSPINTTPTPGILPGQPTPNTAMSPTDTSNSLNPQNNVNGNVLPTATPNDSATATQGRSNRHNWRHHRGSAATPAELQQDRQVADALNQAFPQTPGVNGGAALGGISNLQVTSQNGRVTLRGTVGTQQQKDDATARAAALVGGKQNVDNDLIVK